MQKLTKSQYDQWIADLRSGNYKEGTGELHNVEENTFCCLGVLNARFGECPPHYAYIYKEDDDSSFFQLIDESVQRLLASFNDITGGTKVGNVNFNIKYMFPDWEVDEEAITKLQNESKDFTGVADFIEYIHEHHYKFYEEVNKTTV